MPPAPHIAVIDDEDAIRKALRRHSRSAGMTVETYSGGAEFLSSLAADRPDCAVLDLHMPDVTGFDVLSSLSEKHPGIPVVAITGNDSPESESCALSAGAVQASQRGAADRHHHLGHGADCSGNSPS